MALNRLVEAVRARGGRGAPLATWWGEPDAAAIDRAEAELVRRTGQPLPPGLKALWAHFNGIVIGNPGPSTPADPIVDAAGLPELFDRTGGMLVVGADHAALFEYVDDALPGHLLLGATSEVDVLTVSNDGAVHVVDVDNFDDGPITLAATFDAFLDAWCDEGLRAGTLVQTRRDERPARMKLYRGHQSSVMFRAGEPAVLRLRVALGAGAPLQVSLHDVTVPTSVVVEIEGEARLVVTDGAPTRFEPTRTGDHVIRVEARAGATGETGPFTLGFTIPAD